MIFGILGLMLQAPCLPPLYDAALDKQGSYYEGVYSNGDGWEECAIVYKNGKQIKKFENTRHVHNVFYHNAHSALYVAVGDEYPREPMMKGRSRLEASYDNGATRKTIANHDRANYLAMAEYNGDLYVGEDSAQFNPGSRILKYDGSNFTPVFTLPNTHRGNIGYIQKVGEYFLIGSFTDQKGYKAGIRATKDFKKFTKIYDEEVPARGGFGPGTIQKNPVSFLLQMYK